jgi:hypothetical protein
MSGNRRFLLIMLDKVCGNNIKFREDNIKDIMILK